MINNVQLAEKIKEIAAKQNMTVKEFEEKTNLKRGTITNMTRSKPSIETIEKIANYLNCTIDDLLERQIKKEEKLITTEEIKTIEAYRDAPENIKNIIDTALSQYKKKENRSKLSS